MERIIAIVGPTSSGKTALGVELALRIGGEVISADSRQVYRGLTIGAGKVTREEMRGVPHHLLDVADPQDTFTAHDFVRLGRKAIAEILARGKTPIVVGGTGMYVDALLGRLTLDSPAPSEELRARLNSRSPEELLDELKRIDPAAYARIDTKNRRRVQRALEIAFTPKSEIGLHPSSVAAYDTLWIGLALPREEQNARIAARVHARLAAGMLDEARQLHAEGLSFGRMKELGLDYRELAKHLAGETSYDEMVERIILENQKYAKRQMTWFKKNPAIAWYSPDETEKILEATGNLANRGTNLR